jgi:hypothetical protein
MSGSAMLPVDLTWVMAKAKGSATASKLAGSVTSPLRSKAMPGSDEPLGPGAPRKSESEGDAEKTVRRTGSPVQ